eukprot:CCRYP_018050-RA/>CCRYP_018050-RA protein AED:0.35 eAED:0.02 QI:0/0/0/1/0/0/2/0/148
MSEGSERGGRCHQSRDYGSFACTSMVSCLFCISLVNRIPSLPLTPFFSVFVIYGRYECRQAHRHDKSAYSSGPQGMRCQNCQELKRILRLLLGNRLLMDNCRAIARVRDGRDEVGEEELIKYWESFFCNDKNGPMEKEAIALAMAEFC